MFRIWRRFPCVGVVTKTKLWKGFSYGLYFLDRGGLGTKLSCPGLACNTENREWEWVRTGYGGQHLEVLVQEDHCEFDSSLSYKARPYLKWNKNKNPTATKPYDSVNKVFTTHKNIRIEAWIPRIPVKLNVYTVIPVHLQQHGKLGSLLAGDISSATQGAWEPASLGYAAMNKRLCFKQDRRWGCPQTSTRGS